MYSDVNSAIFQKKSIAIMHIYVKIVYNLLYMGKLSKFGNLNSIMPVFDLRGEIYGCFPE